VCMGSTKLDLQVKFFDNNTEPLQGLTNCKPPPKPHSYTEVQSTPHSYYN